MPARRSRIIAMLETNPSSFLCLAFAHVSLVLLCEEKALKFAGLATMLQLPSFLPSPPRIIKLPAPPAPGPTTLPTLLLPQRFGAALPLPPMMMAQSPPPPPPPSVLSSPLVNSNSVRPSVRGAIRPRRWRGRGPRVRLHGQREGRRDIDKGEEDGGGFCMWPFFGNAARPPPRRVRSNLSILQFGGFRTDGRRNLE